MLPLDASTPGEAAPQPVRSEWVVDPNTFTFEIEAGGPRLGMGGDWAAGDPISVQTVLGDVPGVYTDQAGMPGSDMQSNAIIVAEMPEAGFEGADIMIVNGWVSELKSEASTM